MNPLKESALQIRDAFLAMPLPSRVIAGMLVATIAIGLGLLIQSTSKSEGTYLFGGESFSESEVAEMELAFSAAGLSQWQREGRRIKVPAGSLHTFLKALDESGKVPTRLASEMESALNSSNPLELNGQRISRETWAKQQMISRQICLFPEVRSAVVHYDKSERGFRREGVQTASVMVTPEGNRPLSPTTIRKIRDMVASAYAGLREEDVTVTDINGRSGDGWSEQENELLTIQRAVEEDYEREIRKLLGGYEPFNVAVHAEIDPTLGTEKTELKYDTERSTLQERLVKRETLNSRPAAGGVPGVEPNVGNQPARIDDAMAQKSSTKDEERETSGVVGQQYTRSQLAGYQTRRVQVSILLPQSYYDKVWRIGYLKQNPDAPPSEIPVPPADELTKLRTEIQQTIKSVVTQQLPRLETGGNDPTSLVEVGDYPDLPEPLLQASSASERAISWLAGSWQAIGLGLLALVALLIARSVARSTPASIPPQFEEGFGLEIPATPAGQQETEAETGDKTRKRMQITGGSLKDELAELIDSNPDVAANVLRSWIGDAA